MFTQSTWVFKIQRDSSHLYSPRAGRGSGEDERKLALTQSLLHDGGVPGPSTLMAAVTLRPRDEPHFRDDETEAQQDEEKLLKYPDSQSKTRIQNLLA